MGKGERSASRSYLLSTNSSQFTEGKQEDDKDRINRRSELKKTMCNTCVLPTWVSPWTRAKQGHGDSQSPSPLFFACSVPAKQAHVYLDLQQNDNNNFFKLFAKFGVVVVCWPGVAGPPWLQSHPKFLSPHPQNLGWWLCVGPVTPWLQLHPKFLMWH